MKKQLRTLAMTVLITAAGYGQIAKEKSPEEIQSHRESQDAKMAMLQSQSRQLSQALGMITEFQQFLKVQQDMQQLRQQIDGELAASVEEAKKKAEQKKDVKPVPVVKGATQ